MFSRDHIRATVDTIKATGVSDDDSMMLWQLLNELETVESARDSVLALHSELNGHCDFCATPAGWGEFEWEQWPCLTVQALTNTEASDDHS